MQPAELNYEIYDKERLAIFEAFRQWRNYLEGSTHIVLVLSDHKNLEYFATTKLLTRHQVCWSEYLSGFNYLIHYQAGWLGTKPDALIVEKMSILVAMMLTCLLTLITSSPCSKLVSYCTQSSLDLASLLVSIRHGLQTDPITQSHLTRLRVSPDLNTPVPAIPSPGDPGHFQKMATSFTIRNYSMSRIIRTSDWRSSALITTTTWLATRASPRRSRTFTPILLARCHLHATG